MSFEWSASYSFSATDVTKILIILMIFLILYMLGLFKIYKKAGKPGWGIFIPFYNFYLLFDILYKKGWKFLLLFVPFYNIYLLFKIPFRLASMFGRGTLFGFGLLFLPFLFYPILGFGRYDYIYHTVPVDMMNSMDSGDSSKKELDSDEKKEEYVNPMLDTLLKTSHTQEEINSLNSGLLKDEESKVEPTVSTSFVTISNNDDDEKQSVSVENTPQIVGGNPVNSELANAVDFVEFLPNTQGTVGQTTVNNLLTPASNLISVENRNMNSSVQMNSVSSPVENVQQVNVPVPETVEKVEATPQNFSANVVPVVPPVQNAEQVSVPVPETVEKIEATPQNFSANVIPVVPPVQNIEQVSVPVTETVENVNQSPVQSINPVNIVGLEQTSASFTGVNEASQQFDFSVPVLPPMVDTPVVNQSISGAVQNDGSLSIQNTTSNLGVPSVSVSPSIPTDQNINS